MHNVRSMTMFRSLQMFLMPKKKEKEKKGKKKEKLV